MASRTSSHNIKIVTSNSFGDSHTGTKHTIPHPFLSPLQLRNGDVIEHGGWVPIGIQMIVSPREWARSRPELVQERREVLRVGG
jgi:hypothetical protein